MTFPETKLPIQVDVSLDGVSWTDITPRARGEQQIRISRGRSDWGQQTDFGRCSLTLDNADGAFSPRNPTGPYFGQIGRNTPIRVSVNTGSVALDLPGNAGDYATTPDTAALDITGDLDVRVDATLENWVQPDYPSTGQTNYPRTELVSKRDTGQISWALYITAGRPYLEWSTDGTTERSAWANSGLPLTTSGRIAVRATLDVNNGIGGFTVAFYTAPTIDGPWTLLDSGAFTTGVTSIFAGTAPVRIGDASEETTSRPALGRVHAVEIRNGIGGTLVADADFTAQTSGASSFVDSAGRTWTLGGNATITNRKVRFVGEVASWTPKWETGGHDPVCEVEAAGVLRRLGVGAVPTKSPFYREFTSPGRVAAGIVAYWPMEDGAGATRLASAFSGHPAMTVTGAVTLAAYSDWVASDPVPTISGGAIRVSVPTYTAPGSTRLGFFGKVPSGGVASTQRLMSLSQAGSTAVWSVYVNTAGNLAVRAYDGDGVQIHDSGFGADSINGLEKYLILTLDQDGLFVDYTLLVVDIAASLPTSVPDGSSSTFSITGTVAGTTNRITQVRFGEDGAMGGTAVGHLAIGSSSTAFTASAGAMVGWNAEEASSRISRLGIEEQLHAYATGPGDEQCGPQPRGTALDTMRNTAEVDGGILAELRTVLGLRYVTRASLYSQPPALTLDYTGDDGLVAPLSPADDDQSVTNDVTVQRTGGSSARVTLTEGTLSTQAPPNGIGLYDTSYTLNLLDDSQPLQHAGWRLHLGTWDETRYPIVTVNLANAPTSIEAAAAVDTGSRLQITNPPSWLPPDTIDLLVQGYTETLDQFTWTLAFNCSPAGPWDVAWTGDSSTASASREFQWTDTEGSQLAEELDATETGVDVYTTTGPVWTPYVKDTPFDWRVGGEVMTVVAPGSLLNVNPFFNADVTGWTGVSCTLARSTAVVNPHPRAQGSMLITPAGGVASVSADGDLTATDTITPGATYVISGWFYSPAGWSDLRPSVHWYTNAGAFISTSGAAQAAVPAGQWTYLEDTVTAPSTAGRCKIRARSGNTPSASDLFYVWAARITRSRSSWLYDTFTRTSASGWGIADSGNTWSSVGGGAATDYTLSGTYASHVLSTVDTTRRSGIAAPSADFDIYCDITTSALATGDSLYGAVTARMLDASNMYMARLEFTTSNTILLSVRKVITGTQTELGAYTLADATHVAGTFIRVRFQGNGTALNAKAWRAGDIEPDVWQITATDSAITAANQIGTRSIRSTGNTNAATVAVRYDNFEVVNPQTYTVTRSANTVSKSHSAGADVALAFPAYLAL